MSKIKVAVLFGGTNTEHEVSLVSAKGIIDNLDKNKYDIVPIKITKENTWISAKQIEASYQPVIAEKIVSPEISIDSIDDVMEDNTIDVVIPVLHGPYGEDGTIQGMLELMRLPYVGCNVTGSAVCMDKVIQKNIVESYGIKVAPHFWFTKGEWSSDQHLVMTKLFHKLNTNPYPLFIKPVNQGSSVGVTKAHNEQELREGIELALTRDLKVIVERGIENVREIECAILGTGDDPQASALGEIIPGNEFYDYEAKYLSDVSQAIIPAQLSKKLTEDIQNTAKLAFKVLECYGLSRVDFLVDSKTGEHYLNELNTFPGFTPISMYPKLWEASGISYSKLIDRLIELALARHREKSTLNLSK
jgi:D-alanine-D-alanine ligase